MSIWDIFKKKETKRAITYDQLAKLGGFIESPTRSGVSVTEETALGISALWCGIKVISQDVGSLEPVLYREVGQQREIATSNPIHALLTESPNLEQTRPVFFETLQSHALLFGNAFAEIERTNAGEPVALWPIHPGNVKVGRTEKGELAYEVTTAQGSVVLSSYDVLHVPGLSADGSVGYKLLQVARETLGFGIAAQRYGSSFFGNAARPSGVLQTQGQLNETARDNLRKSWNQLHQGTDNVGKVAILEEGLVFTPFQLTNEQSQYKDILNWFVYEVARFLNCPPSKLHSLEKATWGNLETLNTDYLTTTLRPWLIKWEKELEKKLLSEIDKPTHYVEFDTTLLLRADISTRYSAYATALTNGFLTVDEVRAKENLPPLPVQPEPIQGANEQA
jgi:HK97 family phage portal protein